MFHYRFLRFSLHLVTDEKVEAIPLVLLIAEKEIELYLKPAVISMGN